jgi:hypothetical protein
VDGHVHLAALEHGVDLLDVQALAAELGQIALPQVGLGGDGGQLDPEVRLLLAQEVGHHVGLGQRHR